MGIIIAVSAAICVFALVATVLIGIKPNDKNYEKTTKGRFTLIAVIYIITFIPALIFVFIYFYTK